MELLVRFGSTILHRGLVWSKLRAGRGFLEAVKFQINMWNRSTKQTMMMKQ